MLDGRIIQGLKTKKQPQNAAGGELFNFRQRQKKTGRWHKVLMAGQKHSHYLVNLGSSPPKPGFTYKSFHNYGESLKFRLGWRNEQSRNVNR